jgi:hypothetical protein
MLLDFLYHHPNKLLVADLIRRTCQFERPHGLCDADYDASSTSTPFASGQPLTV